MGFSTNFFLAAAFLANASAFQTVNLAGRTPTQLPVTVIEDWQVTDTGSVVGKVRGSADIMDGEMISTSPLANPAGAAPSTFVRSASGSEYLLGSPAGYSAGGTMPIRGMPAAPGGGVVSRNQFLQTGGLLALASGAAVLGYTVVQSGTFGGAATSAGGVISEGEWTRMMPGLTDPTREILTPREVAGLFGLWNQALLTGNPDTVAQRYAKGAVLLPTKSDIPRTDYEGIRDYFVKFLAKKPTGTILESYGKF
jgi:hypothetical protein